MCVAKEAREEISPENMPEVNSSSTDVEKELDASLRGVHHPSRERGRGKNRTGVTSRGKQWEGQVRPHRAGGRLRSDGRAEETPLGRSKCRTRGGSGSCGSEKQDSVASLGQQRRAGCVAPRQPRGREAATDQHWVKAWSQGCYKGRGRPRAWLSSKVPHCTAQREGGDLYRQSPLVPAAVSSRPLCPSVLAQHNCQGDRFLTFYLEIIDTRKLQK